MYCMTALIYILILLNRPEGIMEYDFTVRFETEPFIMPCTIVLQRIIGRFSNELFYIIRRIYLNRNPRPFTTGTSLYTYSDNGTIFTNLPSRTSIATLSRTTKISKLAG